MSEFYTYSWQYGNKVLTRGYRDGVPFIERDPSFKPKLYVRSNEPSEIRGLYGEQLKEIEFSNPSDAREFLETYKGIDNYPIYGQTDLTYQYLSEKYPNDVPFDIEVMGIWSLDIETKAENGFPNVDEPIEEVLLITVMNNKTKQVLTWGIGEWKPQTEQVKKLDVTYVPCDTERE
ncbi:DNA polymerase, partial [bacterium]|nr:DNA polymerase [bacterium]